MDAVVQTQAAWGLEGTFSPLIPAVWPGLLADEVISKSEFLLRTGLEESKANTQDSAVLFPDPHML